MTPELSQGLMRARLQLMLRYSYLAAAVARFPLQEVAGEAWCRTAATDGYNIMVNPAYFAPLSEDERMGILAHEVLHCLLGHIDRRDKRDRFLWNVAIDFAVNFFLLDNGFKLPSGLLYDIRFKGKTAEDIYAEIIKTAMKSKADWVLWDSHLDPGDVEGKRFRIADFPAEVERRRLRGQLSREFCSKLSRREAGMLSEEIKLAGQAKVRWQEVLAQFFKGISHNDYSLYPFNKKHLWRGILLPSMKAPGLNHIVVAIDTSGSMETQTLSAVLAEIDALRGIANCAITLIQCDLVIHWVKRYEAWEVSTADFTHMKMKGRGGTSLVPPFQWVVSRENEDPNPPDAFIYLTDGYGDFPEHAPSFPCLWITPEDAFDKFPFGQVLRVLEP
jgi:predicted metal-dependent peptidase